MVRSQRISKLKFIDVNESNGLYRLRKKKQHQNDAWKRNPFTR
jgi:hypothetical protein